MTDYTRLSNEELIAMHKSLPVQISQYDAKQNALKIAL